MYYFLIRINGSSTFVCVIVSDFCVKLKRIGFIHPRKNVINLEKRWMCTGLLVWYFTSNAMKFKHFQLTKIVAKRFYDSQAFEHCWEMLSLHFLSSFLFFTPTAVDSMETLDCLFHTVVKSSAMYQAHFSPLMLITRCEMHWFLISQRIRRRGEDTNTLSCALYTVHMQCISWPPASIAVRACVCVCLTMCAAFHQPAAAQIIGTVERKQSEQVWRGGGQRNGCFRHFQH